MKPFLLLLFLSFCTTLSAQQKTDCSNFRTGNFRYTDEKFSEVLITRTETTQTEIDKANNSKVVGSIKWLSDCEYEFTYEKVSVKAAAPLIGVTIHVIISDVKGNAFTCTGEAIGYKLIMGMKKVETP